MPDTESEKFTSHNSFAEIAPLYDGFILDQFGVMHNGASGLPGAPECVAQLASSGKKLIILSNTSSSSVKTLDKLPRLGFDKANFSGAVTSGEEASRYIAETYGPQGKKALFITWGSGRSGNPLDFIDQCGGISITNSADEADFVIAHGSDVIRGNNDDKNEAIEISLGGFAEKGDFSVLDPILKKCEELRLPMVCANPDFIMVNPNGSEGHMPGKIGQHYESIGGKCTYFGKPHVPHFEACLRELGLDKQRVAHVGDSLHHDIAGANAAGINSVFVAGGIHRKDLGSELGDVPDESALQKLFENEGQFPSHVVPMLKM
eukprot:CAMPEP_0195524910 /NCGR_PEP_ID=MMETSP0794_2-20130614/25021_1 /TAXON_ID=515487 /ORGANISM="Stephanopyxis turris, Strain CCMP 815" /LENGTH=318 /DNA_ID=CAMNT_0040655235 /DNA_START=35 /DNA_END=991 /DNA_ORIENTATION=+